MSESKPNSAKALTGVLALVSIAAVVFAVLWLQERDRKPHEVLKEVEKTVRVTNEVPVEKIVQVVKEVPVERIREVPKEVLKEVEVPAKFSDAQKAALDFTARYFSAPMVESSDEIFYKLETVTVGVFLNDALKTVISEDRLKDKFELILRKHNIRLAENSPFWIRLSIEGLWSENGNIVTYTASLKLTEKVTVGRKGDLRGVIATTWEKGSFGFVGKNNAEKTMLEKAEERAETFANKLLTIRDKEAAKEGSKVVP